MNRVYPPVHGATGRVLRDLARAFAKEGWQVTVVTTGPIALRERDGGIRVIRIKAPEKPSNIFVYAWVWLMMFIKVMRLPSSHLVVTMSDPPLLVLAGRFIARFKKSRHIHWCHDLYPDIFPALGFYVPSFLLNFFKRQTKTAMADADKVIVIGRCMARHLTLNAVDPKHITVIPNWPDLELTLPSGQNGAHTTSFQDMRVNGSKPYEEQLKNGPKFRVLYAGNIGRAHPVESILDAAAILHEPHPEIEFVFVGSGARFDDLARERTRRGLDNIRLMPYQPASRLREVMESGDIHLVSMREEAAGMLVPSKLYAALAVGRPCIFIGPTQSETAKVITDFRAGVVVPQGDAVALAEQIRHYRLNGEDWFSAHNGAAEAGQIFVPGDAINAWLERAWSVVQDDLGADMSMAA